MTAEDLHADELHWYLSDELEQVPTRPGLYAWYFVPLAGPLDWQELIDAAGNDAGIKTFGDFLARHTDRVQLPPLSLRATGTLGAMWAGGLDDRASTKLSENLKSLANGRNGRGAALRWTLQNAGARECLAQVLLNASPRLSPPIYIGVARNLRSRLDQHMTSFADATDDPANATNSFGSRAASAGLRRDELRVAVLPIPELEQLSDDDLRRVAEAAEYVLNRWHRPMLGER